MRESFVEKNMHNLSLKKKVAGLSVVAQAEPSGSRL